MSAISLLEHVGVPYSDPEALVESIGPRVAAAIAAGDDVYLSVDRRTARGFREWLGASGDAVAYPSPSRWPRDIVRDMLGVVERDRHTLVVGQYTASGIDGREMAQVEDGVNLVLGDLPLTLLCTCADMVSPALGAALRFGHPSLWVDGVAVPNPDYREPAAYRPVTGALWGPPTSRLEFRAPVDLHRLREHVAQAAEAVGLRGETVREAVLATHEAAVLAAGGVGATVFDPLAETATTPDAAAAMVPCVLEIRADTGVLYCEILGPRPDGGMRVGAGGDPLHIVRMFCDGAQLHDEADVRTVRVLRAPHTLWSPAA